MKAWLFTLFAVLAAGGAWAGSPVPASTVIAAPELARVMANPDLIIIDTRGAKGAFETRRLKGARFLDWDRWDKKLANGATGADPEWTAMLNGLGLTANAPVLLYDDGRMAASAMIWVALRTFGVSDVTVLSTRFSRLGSSVPAGLFESGPAAPVRPSAQAWTVGAGRAPRVITTGDVLARIADPAPLLFDNRTLAEFDGADSAKEPGVRPGHIPKALWLPKNVFFDATDEPISPKDVTAIARGYGLEPGTRLAVYCRTGGRASAVALLLWQAGYHAVDVYEGSWLQWGADPNLPVERR